eukprot:766783-Hanusia_phi.AAC.1
MSTKEAYMLCNFGNAKQNVPAMKTMKGTDFISRNDAKRLSDLRFLMRTNEIESNRTRNL